MVITIQGTSVCPGGEHITVVTDKGSFMVTSTEIQTMADDDFEANRRDALAITKHQFLTRRAAGRTVAQARADLNGFPIRL